MSIIGQVDGIAAISRVDAKKYLSFGLEVKLETIPFGIDIEDYRPTDASAGNEEFISFGAMDWKPNIESLWFTEEIFRA